MTDVLTNFAVVLIALVGFFALPAFGDAPTTQQSTVLSDPGTPQEQSGVGLDEKLGHKLPLAARFSDEYGNSVTLGDLFQSGRPVIIQLGYLDCPMLCDTVSQGLVRSMADIEPSVGKDFDFLFITIDPHETRAQAYAIKRRFVAMYGRDGAAAGWHYLFGNKASIDAITDAIGFRYKWIESVQQYSHPAVLAVISPQGKITKYLYGVDYPPDKLRLAISQASEEKVDSVFDRVLMVCLHYDSRTGKYTLAAMTLMRAAGVLTLGVIGTFIGGKLWHDRRAARQALPPN